MILDALAALLPGLMPAAFRGVPFDVLDTSTSVGRRIAEHLFPGHDRAAYDDMGKRPEIVSLSGLVVGDDYVLRAQALRRAFAQAGPGTLVHPWLGSLTVVLDDAGEISFSAGELRVARIDVAFRVLPSAAGPSTISTLARVASTALAGVAAARALASAVGQRSGSRVAGLASARSGRLAAAAWTAAPSPVLRPLAAQVSGSSPVAFAAGIDALGAALVAKLPTGTPAIGAAAEAQPVPAAIAPAALQSTALDVAARLFGDAVAAPSAADRALLSAAGADALSRSAELASSIAFVDRSQAVSVREGLRSAFEGASNAAQPLISTVFAGESSAMLRALLALEVASRADISETIGRLPRLVTVPVDRATSAFLIAHSLYGDTPEAIEAGYEAILRRNRYRHPGALEGRVEAPQ